MRKTYFVEPQAVTIRKRFARACFALAIFVAVTYIFHLVWSKQRKLSLEEYVVDAIIAAGVDAFGSTGKRYEIEVSDDEIQMRRGGSTLKRARRGHIRSFYEVAGNPFREPALRISEHGRLGTFFLGCVGIPATLPEYQQIKALALSWMAIG